MNPSSTLRVRRAIAGLFVAWAVTAIALSLAALRAPGERLYHPFIHTRSATISVIDEVSPDARAAGMEPGDIILAMNGRPFH
jgi:S1-C subfamily serine protease